MFSSWLAGTDFKYTCLYEKRGKKGGVFSYKRIRGIFQRECMWTQNQKESIFQKYTYLKN